MLIYSLLLKGLSRQEGSRGFVLFKVSIYSLQLEPKAAGATFVADKDEIRPSTRIRHQQRGRIRLDRGARSGPTVQRSIDHRPTGSDSHHSGRPDAGSRSSLVQRPDPAVRRDHRRRQRIRCHVRCKIFGIEILNEGWGSSIDDAVSEQQATFVARTVEPMAALASPNLNTSN